jgi:arginase
MSLILVPYHLDEHLTDLNVSLPDAVDATTVTVGPSETDVWSRLARLYDAVASVVERAAQAGSVPAAVSGDCTASIGITAGLQRAGVDPSIVWVDAHGDVQTLETTTSGYLGGMALRVLLGYCPELVAEHIGLHPPSESQVLLVDARDLDPPEVDYLASAQVRRSTVEELSVETLPDGPLLLNLDLDVLDPAALPGLRYPAPHGPDVPAVLRVVRTIVDSGRVAALNLACTWLPGQTDVDGVREHLVTSVLKSLWDRGEDA